MLSRTADSLYWLGRYMERAGNTARALQVALREAGMGGGRPAQGQGWRALLLTSGDIGLLQGFGAAPDAAQARLAAPEAAALTGVPVYILEGGSKAWRAAGLPMAADRRVPADADCADFYLRPYDRNDGVEAAMREYLSWEVDLVNEVAKDGDAPFGHWH